VPVPRSRWPTRAKPPYLSALQTELPGVRFVAGEFTAALVDGQSLSSVYRSPGLSPASVAPVFNAARSIGLPTGGELDLFAFALKGLREAHGYAPKVLGITGTNGKTTVTSLTGQLLEHGGLSVGVAGNIGPTLLDTLSGRIDAETLPQAWVLELSSFQLDDCRGFEPTAATVLNITQDHLDWHGGMQAYADAKAHVFGEQALMVLNREDPVVMAMLPAPVAVPGKRGKTFQRAHVTFGGDMPRRPGDFGLEVVNGMTWLVRAHEADETSKGKNVDDLHIVRLMPADALRIRGRHNAINALSALALATGAGCTLAPLLYGLREYRGEPHRVQPVGRVGDVEYFDDSKGTNVGATVAALMGLGPDHRIVVILGGLGKGQDFTPLAARLALCARGRADRPGCAADSRGAGRHRRDLVDAATMQDAVQQAARWPMPMMRCCSRRPAPAWTCSRTTRTAPTSLWKRCASWRLKPASNWRTAHDSRLPDQPLRPHALVVPQRGDKPIDVLPVRVGGPVRPSHPHAGQRAGAGPGSDLGGHRLAVLESGHGVFGIDCDAGQPALRQDRALSLSAAPHHVDRHGLCGALLAFQVPMNVWEKVARKLFLISIVLLVAVLIRMWARWSTARGAGCRWAS
jgi:UDP-N-acetylmuramoylalanine--D-glutamate ligase